MIDLQEEAAEKLDPAQFLHANNGRKDGATQTQTFGKSIRDALLVAVETWTLLLQEKRRKKKRRKKNIPPLSVSLWSLINSHRYKSTPGEHKSPPVAGFGQR